uniref:Uncharacterized protein n=1 Tax=Rhizophora mucronata TaxID=61149 RepID=A0A2P2QMA2_RHIMU
MSLLMSASKTGQFRANKTFKFGDSDNNSWIELELISVCDTSNPTNFGNLLQHCEANPHFRFLVPKTDKNCTEAKFPNATSLTVSDSMNATSTNCPQYLAKAFMASPLTSQTPDS